MARTEAKVDYDQEYDILRLYTGKKINDSLKIDNFIIDFSPDDKVVGVELLDASKIVNKVSSSKITKEDLSKIKNSYIQVSQSNELVFIVLMLVLSNNEEVNVSVTPTKQIMSATA